MNPDQALAAYRGIVVVNAAHIALELSLQLRNASIEAQRAAFGGDKEVGWVYLYRHPTLHTDTVLESVASPDGMDTITSTYKNHPALANIGELIRTRRNLIRALASKVGLSAENIGIEDPVRGRMLGLTELSTGQLIDMLAEKAGVTIQAPTESLGGDIEIVQPAGHGDFDVKRIRSGH
jgi:hypothetical protein